MIFSDFHFIPEHDNIMCNWMIKSFLHQILLNHGFANLLENVREASGAHVIR